MPDDQYISESSEIDGVVLTGNEAIDEETGLPIVYDENLPEFFRQEYKLSPMRRRYAVRLDAMCPLERSSRGRLGWNTWVKAFKRSRWCVYEKHSDHIFVRLKHMSVSIREDEVVDYEGGCIDFSIQQRYGDGGFFMVHQADFCGFVFPAPTFFSHARFDTTVRFSNALFLERVWFQEAQFEESAYFDNVRFNKYACFQRAYFDLYAKLSQALFHGVADFKDACFRRTGWFDEAWFGGDTYFDDALFLGSTLFRSACFTERFSCRRGIFLDGSYWYGAKFHGGVDFDRTQFRRSTSFRACKFEGIVNFDHTYFGRDDNTPKHRGYAEWDEPCKAVYERRDSEAVPDFMSAVFSINPNLGYMHVLAPPAPDGIRQSLTRWLGIVYKGNSISDPNAAAKFRRLAELAAQRYHHHAEKRFFRGELLARRGHEAKGWPEVMMINLFELFSKCGLSFWRPFGWWISTTILVAAFMGYNSSLSEIGFNDDDLGHLVNYTLSNATPIFGVLKSSDSAAVQALFGELSPWMRFWSGVHNFVSSVFLFFALLAVRNYFKLG